MLRGYSFRPRRLGAFGALAAALACVAFVGLGQWQARRAEEKRAIGAALDRAAKAAPIELTPDVSPAVHQRVVARGPFVAERTVLLDNKVRRGRAGYEVVTPLRLGNSESHVLVNRGWVAAAATREVLPEVRTPGGEQRIEGLVLERLPQALQAGAAPRGAVRQNLVVADFAAETGLRLHPVVIEQHSALDDGLLREWPRPDLGIEKHDSYSLQWYSLAALTVILFVSLSFSRAGES
ncbi:MAG TPA: SURF1 family protein [Burkholderiales bacterium]|nr:SURF1 family protein [Burkholderiales bacterium]